MENCESGCPCAEFNCDLSLNVTDPVIGLESMGILDTSGNPCYRGMRLPDGQLARLPLRAV